MLLKQEYSWFISVYTQFLPSNFDECCVSIYAEALLGSTEANRVPWTGLVNTMTILHEKYLNSIHAKLCSPLKLSLLLLNFGHCKLPNVSPSLFRILKWRGGGVDKMCYLIASYNIVAIVFLRLYIAYIEPVTRTSRENLLHFVGKPLFIRINEMNSHLGNCFLQESHDSTCTIMKYYALCPSMSTSVIK